MATLRSSTALMITTASAPPGYLLPVQAHFPVQPSTVRRQQLPAAGMYLLKQTHPPLGNLSAPTAGATEAPQLPAIRSPYRVLIRLPLPIVAETVPQFHR